jgi:hypothetical protein
MEELRANQCLRQTCGISLRRSYLLGLQLAQGRRRTAHDRDQQARGVLSARVLRMRVLFARYEPSSARKRTIGDRYRDTVLSRDKSRGRQTPVILPSSGECRFPRFKSVRRAKDPMTDHATSTSAIPSLRIEVSGQRHNVGCRASKATGDVGLGASALIASERNLVFKQPAYRATRRRSCVAKKIAHFVF